MRPSIYFVNPSADFPTYFGAENYRANGLAAATQMADLAIPTLAAMAAPELDVSLCDQNIDDVDLDTSADFVGITGKISQFAHMVSLSREFRARGKTVLIGGPFATLSPAVVRPHCDILVRGEIEEIAPEIFGDLASRRWKDEYVGNKPSLDLSPVPRWDLYHNDRALLGTVQTSRGCPFECEFCDVIQYAGRKQRHKRVSQILAELDVLYECGYRNVFLADDNFTVYRSRAREVLMALRDWNAHRPQGRVSFLTQVSIDAAKDDALLGLCAEAGLVTVFIGIETPNEESLRETKKRQNLRVDLVEEVHAFLARGIHVVGGMIVGFDSDGPEIFGRQLAFASASGIPIFSLGALVAPAATPLHARLAQAGRLKPRGSEVAAVPWTTNIIHPKFDEAELLNGLRWLGNNLYSPIALAERLLVFIDKLGKRRDGRQEEGMSFWNGKSVDADSMDVLSRLPSLGPEEDTMWTRIGRAIAGKPDAKDFVFAALLQYMQIRYMYDLGQFWEPRLAAEPVLPTASSGRPPADRLLPVVS
jgi:radical SAM superfamily enzyme YgiQ (UPF0313 family)